MTSSFDIWNYEIVLKVTLSTITLSKIEILHHRGTRIGLKKKLKTNQSNVEPNSFIIIFYSVLKYMYKKLCILNLKINILNF